MESTLLVGALMLSTLGSGYGCSLRTSRNLQAYEYDYSLGPNGPAHWADPENNNFCGGRAQSPINIPSPVSFDTEVLGNIDAFNFEYTPINVSAAAEEHSHVELENLGTTVEMLYHGFGEKLVGGEEFAKILHREDSNVPDVDELQDEFTLEQFHFHWGLTDDTGSEHAYAGRHFPLEMHMVHYNSGKYADFSEASGHSDGLLVVAVMFEKTAINPGNELLAPLADTLLRPDFLEGASFEKDEFDLVGMTDALNSGAFYLYAGSLTTPPCSEVVTWVLLKEPMEISTQTLNAFRNVHQKPFELISPNYRPLQDGASRVVYDIETQTAVTLGKQDDSQPPINGVGYTEMLATVVVLGVAVLLLLLVGLVAFTRSHKSRAKTNEEAVAVKSEGL